MSTRLLVLFIGILSSMGTALAAAPKHIVSEDIVTFLRTGPSDRHRAPYLVKAGEALTVVGPSQDGFTEVSDSRGRTGWIENKNLAKGPGFRAKLPELTAELEKAKAQLAEVTAERDALEASQTSQQSQSRKQSKELLRLQEENQSLTTQVEKLSQEERFIWMKQGGIVAGAGLIIGFIVAYIPRPRRRRRNDGWA